MARFTNKVVVVSGAGSVGPGWGNGKSIAVLFARQGARIFGVDISEAAARETQAIITGEGGTCEVATGDVTDAAEVARLVEACMARFGRIDVLVNNVGKSEPARFSCRYLSRPLDLTCHRHSAGSQTKVDLSEKYQTRPAGSALDRAC